jgi:hypothetical protein
MTQQAPGSLIDRKDELAEMLQTAFELELGTLPPYLMATISLRPGCNVVASNIIHEVAMEEMLHLLLVGNLMASLRIKPKLGPENLPAYPLRMKFKDKTFADRDFEINLSKFSKESLSIFTQIEQPSFLRPPRPELLLAEIDIPGYTVGDFYSSILTKLEELCSQFGEKNVFAAASRQVDESYYWWGRGKPIVVTNLKSATEALKLIINQGEGAVMQAGQSGPFSAHYFRFKSILAGRYFKEGQNVEDEPSGEPLEVDFSEASVYPIVSNPQNTTYGDGTLLSKLNFDFNRRYTLMLIQVVEALSGSPEVMYTAIMNGMHGLVPIARQMVSTQIEPGGQNGSPSFEWCDPLL